MPRPPPRTSLSSSTVDAALRAALHAPAPADVAPPSTADFLALWRSASARSVAEIVPFSTETPADPLAFAARSGAAISEETRERIAALVRRLREEREGP